MLYLSIGFKDSCTISALPFPRVCLVLLDYRINSQVKIFPFPSRAGTTSPQLWDRIKAIGASSWTHSAAEAKFFRFSELSNFFRVMIGLWSAKTPSTAPARYLRCWVVVVVVFSRVESCWVVLSCVECVCSCWVVLSRVCSCSLVLSVSTWVLWPGSWGSWQPMWPE